ncbi:Chymotrypsin inhibitor [Lucilia cuprina]|nr:Chymotrypsin inhibitor [Lucilia cuprina]
MLQFAKLILLLLSFIFLAFAQESCPPNQEYSTCISTCPPTCSNPNPRSCLFWCRSGCKCIKGFILNDNGDCVKPSDC